jgi:S-adenosylmethionine synthetase
VHTVVVSVQHSEKISLEDLREDVMAKVIRVVIPEKYLDEKTTFHINPCGLFVVGGPQVSGGILTPFALTVLYGCSF